jgi:hypothetical protein
MEGIRCFASAVDLTRHPPEGSFLGTRLLNRNALDRQQLRSRNILRLLVRNLMVHDEEPISLVSDLVAADLHAVRQRGIHAAETDRERDHRHEPQQLHDELGLASLLVGQVLRCSDGRNGERRRQDRAYLLRNACRMSSRAVSVAFPGNKSGIVCSFNDLRLRRCRTEPVPPWPQRAFQPAPRGMIYPGRRAVRRWRPSPWEGWTCAP